MTTPQTEPRCTTSHLTSNCITAAALVARSDWDYKTTTIWIACSDWTIATDDLSSTQRNVVTGLEHLALEHLALGNFSALLIKEMYRNDEGSCRNRGEQESQTKVQTGLCLQLDKKSMEIKNRRRKMWKKMVQAKLECISLRKRIIKRRKKKENWTDRGLAGRCEISCSQWPLRCMIHKVRFYSWKFSIGHCSRIGDNSFQAHALSPTQFSVACHTPWVQHYNSAV